MHHDRLLITRQGLSADRDFVHQRARLAQAKPYALYQVYVGPASGVCTDTTIETCAVPVCQTIQIVSTSDTKVDKSAESESTPNSKLLVAALFKPLMTDFKLETTVTMSSSPSLLAAGAYHWLIFQDILAYLRYPYVY